MVWTEVWPFQCGSIDFLENFPLGHLAFLQNFGFWAINTNFHLAVTHFSELSEGIYSWVLWVLQAEKRKRKQNPPLSLKKLDQSPNNIGLRMHMPLLPKGISYLSAKCQRICEKPGVDAPYLYAQVKLHKKRCECLPLTIFARMCLGGMRPPQSGIFQ